MDTGAEPCRSKAVNQRNLNAREKTGIREQVVLNGVQHNAGADRTEIRFEALPERCGIAPMAEEFFRGTGLAIGELVTSLERMDELLSAVPED